MRSRAQVGFVVAVTAAMALAGLTPTSPAQAAGWGEHGAAARSPEGTGELRELPGLRTVHSRTYATTRGTYVTRIRATSRPTARAASGPRARAANNPGAVGPTAACGIVNGSSANSSYCTSALRVGRSAGVTYRTLLSFDLTSIPRDAELLEGVLSLYAAKGTTARSTLDVHAATRGWSTPTWNRASAAAAWTTPGGDFDAASSGSLANSGVTGWHRWDIRPLSQAWSERSRTNLGLVVKQRGEATEQLLSFTPPSATRYQPYLHLEYTPRLGDVGRSDQELISLSDKLSLKVNPGNGNLLLTQTDHRFEGTAFNYAVERYYNSLGHLSQPYIGGYQAELGKGWTGLAGNLHATSLDLQKVVMRTGAHIPFDARGDGSWRGPTDTSYTATRPNGSDYVIDDPGRGEKLTHDWFGDALRVDHADGHSLVYSEPTHAEVLRWTDDLGRRTDYLRDSTRYMITGMVDAEGGRHQFVKVGDDLLQAHVGPDGRRTEYTYTTHAGSGCLMLTRVTDDTGLDVRIAYDAAARVSSIKRVTNAATGEGPTWTFAYPSFGRTVVDSSSTGFQTHYFYDEGLKTTDAVRFESDFDDMARDADVGWDWRRAAGFDATPDGPDQRHRFRYRLAGGVWTEWREDPDPSFTLEATTLGAAVEVEAQLVDASGVASRVVAAQIKIAEGPECADPVTDEDVLGPPVHAASREGDLDVFTFSQPLSHAAVLAGLPANAVVTSLVERTIPAGGGAPHTSGVLPDTADTPQMALAELNRYVMNDLDDWEQQVIADRAGASTDAERAVFDRELQRLRVRRATYEARGGVPVSSIAIVHDPAVAQQVAANFASVLETRYKPDRTDDDCPAAAAPTPPVATAAKKGGKRKRARGPVARAAGRLVDNRERGVRHDVPPYSGTYSPPSVRVWGKQTGDCCRSMQVAFRWPRNRYKRYWWQKPRMKEPTRGYEVEVLMDQDKGTDGGGSWGLPAEGRGVWTANFRCAYADDYFRDDLRGSYRLTVGSYCRPRTNSRWLRWTHNLISIGRPERDRVLASVQPVHNAQRDLVGGQLGGVDVSEYRYCQVRRGAYGSCLFGDHLPSITYCDSYDPDRNSLVVPGQLTFKRRLDIKCAVQ